MRLITARHLRHFALGRQGPLNYARQISTSSPPLYKGLGQTGTGSTRVPKGKIFQKEPAKISCDQGQSYKWCSCGLSKKQPFCDGRPLCQPVDFKARESKEYAFCNCKQTNNQPFCDGSHKSL